MREGEVGWGEGGGGEGVIKSREIDTMYRHGVC